MSEENQYRILSSLKEGSLSRKEIMDEIGIEKKTGSLKRTLKDLIERELIEYTIPEKPRSRLQKYRITGKGMNELKKDPNN